MPDRPNQRTGTKRKVTSEMDEEKHSAPTLVVISGPSGVGKSSICKQVADKIRDCYLSVSVTTRAKGDNEINGRDYWFVSQQEFARQRHAGGLLEYAEVFGNFYGTPKAGVEEALKAGRTVILEIDVEGGKQIKAKYTEAEMIFILPPSQRELWQRMNLRDREDAEAVEMRLDSADDEIAAAWQYYDHMVINDDLQQAVEEVTKIILDRPREIN